jgi:cell division protein FtsA
VPETLRKAEAQQVLTAPEPEAEPSEEELQQRRVRARKGKDFWGKFKDGIIDLFKEEEDKAL